ncbi:MAG TPA: hypothetical protein VFM18_08625, partial [Methanosarcina sp.]|nr:hypothetical protein [Methanosarcina sp.]
MGIFTTNADTYANGFYGPQNITYQNPGWGVDPNLMTPSYAAPYRPEYDGSGPYVPSSNPGYFSSLGTLVNPMYQQPLYQTPGQAIQPYVMSAGSRPRDAFMAGMQRYMVPGLAFGAAMKVFGPNTGTVMGDLAGTFTGKGVAGAMGRGFGQGVAGGFMRASGLSGVELNASIQAFNAASKARSVEYAAMRAAQAARTGFGAGAVNAAESMAFNAGTLGQGMRAAYAAGGVRGAAGLAVRGASGAVGAAAANILIPMAIAEGVSATADAAVFDP